MADRIGPGAIHCEVSRIRCFVPGSRAWCFASGRPQRAGDRESRLGATEPGNHLADEGGSIVDRTTGDLDE